MTKSRMIELFPALLDKFVDISTDLFDGQWAMEALIEVGFTDEEAVKAIAIPMSEVEDEEEEM